MLKNCLLISFRSSDPEAIVWHSSGWIDMLIWNDCDQIKSSRNKCWTAFPVSPGAKTTFAFIPWVNSLVLKIVLDDFRKVYKMVVVIDHSLYCIRLLLVTSRRSIWDRYASPCAFTSVYLRQRTFATRPGLVSSYSPFCHESWGTGSDAVLVYIEFRYCLVRGRESSPITSNKSVTPPDLYSTGILKLYLLDFPVGDWDNH